MSEALKISCVWTVKEKLNGLYVPVYRKKNTFTNYGLSALASAITGGYVPPIYLMMDASYSFVYANTSIGSSTIDVTNTPFNAYTSQVVLSAGLSNQEVLGISGITTIQAGQYRITLSSPTAKAHNGGEFVCAQPSSSETMAQMATPVQYDPVNAPNQWTSYSAGYSQGVGNWIAQFYLTAAQAQAVLMRVGLADAQTIGSGNLHSLVVLAYDHTAGTTDIEIDANLTIVNA